jgi:DNA (cytosine-5)-methyltransferase 1
MGELGYGFAYRILDAQYFGVAQRRRRVFVVGYLGDWRRAAAVLFERYSLQRHPTPSRKKGESSSKYSGRGIADYCPTIGCEIAKQVTNQMIGEAEGFFIPEPTSSAFFESSLAGYREADVGGTLKASGGVLGGGSETFLAQPISFDMAQITSKVNGTRVEPGLPVSTLAKGSQMHVAQPIFFEPRSPDGAPRIYPMDGAAPTLNTMSGGQREPCVTQPIGFEANMSLQQPSTGGVFQTLTRRTHASINVNMAVRRLTPVECERLQGFPDNYTDIKPRNKATPDGPRYKVLGNSMAVPVMAWIGKRIQEVENIK